MTLSWRGGAPGNKVGRYKGGYRDFRRKALKRPMGSVVGWFLGRWLGNRGLGYKRF